MLALLVGLACGTVEFFLLRRYISATMEGKISTALICMMIKIFLLLGTLLVSVLLWRKQVITTAIGVVAPLIIGSIVRVCVQNSKPKKGSDTGADQSVD